MTKLERYERMAEFAKGGATHQQLADKFGLTTQRVSQILAAGRPEEKRHRGRPCPNVVNGERCGGSSEVLRVWDEEETDAGVRIRACLVCGYRWETEEKLRAKKSTGSVDMHA